MLLSVITGPQRYGPKCYYWTSGMVLSVITGQVVWSYVLLLDHNGMVLGIT